MKLFKTLLASAICFCLILPSQVGLAGLFVPADSKAQAPFLEAALAAAPESVQKGGLPGAAGLDVDRTALKHQREKITATEQAA